MLEIGINTGTAWLNTFKIEGTERDDVGALIEEYVMDNREDFCEYSIEEIMDICDGDDDVAQEQYYPINGGEFYINRIEMIREV